jgi:hypothetical protein
VFRGDLTFRGLRVLIDGLPADSAFVRAFQGTSWRDSEWILHDVSSQLRVLNASLANTFRKEGATPIEPTFLPTPNSGKSVAEDRTDAFYAQQRTEMDAVADRLFANSKPAEPNVLTLTKP